MAVFLFVTAAVALLVGLVGLVAGSMRQTTGRQKGPPPFRCRPGSEGYEQGFTVHGRREDRLNRGGQAP